MKQVAGRFVILAIATISAACTATQIALAPGADQVRTTKNSADVAACTAVGNVDARPYLDMTNGMRQMQNRTAGLGGNTIFLTIDPSDHVFNLPNTFATGVAYRCTTVVPRSV